MDARPPSLPLVFDAPWLPGARPRLWRLLLGAAAVLAAAVLGWPDQGPAFWNVAVLGDARLAATVLALGGGLAVLQALRSDLRRLQRVALSPRGLQLAWCHAPTLGARWQHVQARLGWDEVASLSWEEGAAEHAPRQFLRLRFARPLAGGMDEWQVPLCRGRRFEHCETVLAALPSGTPVPEWMQAERLRRARGGAVPEAALDD